MADRELIPPGPKQPTAEEQMKGMSRRSFCWAALAVGGTYFTFNRLHAASTHWMKDGMAEWTPGTPFRSALRFDDYVAERIFSTDRLTPTFPDSAITEARVNGDYGLDDWDPSTWKLKVEGLEGGKTLHLSISDLKDLERIEYVTQFKCIEGWNYFMKWGGISLASFIAKYRPAGEPEYVAMETPPNADDGKVDYYVAIDMPAAIHPQTMLCFEMNGKPLSSEHGAPLRLIIPHKYGVKNLKRIGTIRYSKDRPRDYWADEDGYDEYAGL
jgi:DMSO/TMAO reductase YedYZ molybdopterin-dependent catalytic subunit